MRLPWLFALAKFALHLATSQSYGVFRDELYYLAGARRLNFGYVDVPPVAPILAWFSEQLLGDGLTALRLLPALAGAGCVWLTVRMAQLLGGGSFAQTVAGFAALLAPVWLSMHSFFTYDPFDQLAVCGLWFLLLKILQGGRPRLWLAFGACAGVALMTKLTTLFFGVALVFAMAVTEHRKHLASRWIYMGGLIAALTCLPFLLWQSVSGWPLVEYYSNYVGGKTYQASPIEFVLMQIVSLHPLSMVVWGFGLALPFIGLAHRNLRPVVVIFATLLVAFCALKMKFYLLSSSFFPLFAMGAVGWEKVAWRHASLLRKRGALAYLALWCLTGVVIAPNALPLLPVDKLVAYLKLTSSLTGADQIKMERHESTSLPQHFADRFGWPEMVAQVAQVFEMIPGEQRASSLILVNNYGKAGAIDYFGRKFDLPLATSGHLSYFFWRQKIERPTSVVALGYSEELLKSVFSVVEEKAKTFHPYAMPYENHLPIFLCSGLKSDMSLVWEKFKRMD